MMMMARFLMLLSAESEAMRIQRALRVLVVEDSFMTARMIVRMIESFGAEVIGPASSVAKAMVLMDSQDFDGAVLDINLGTETVEPVARRLEESGIPYFFVSGYSSPKSMLSNPKFRERTLLSKPVDPREFERAFADTIRPDAGGVAVQA